MHLLTHNNDKHNSFRLIYKSFVGYSLISKFTTQQQVDHGLEISEVKGLRQSVLPIMYQEVESNWNNLGGNGHKNGMK